MKTAKTAVLFLALFFVTAINYQAEVVKKFPHAQCLAYQGQFFIAGEPGQTNQKWLSREQTSCPLAWQEAYLRNVGYIRTPR